MNNTRDSKINQNRGFTLLEVLISTTILIIVVAAAAGTAVMAINSGTYNRDRTIAENLARREIENIRAMRETDFLDDDPDTAWDKNNSVDSAEKKVTPPAIDDREFTIETRVSLVPNNTNGGDNGAGKTKDDGTGETQYVDEHQNMRKVVVIVSWDEAFLGTRDVKIVTYITNNK